MTARSIRLQVEFDLDEHPIGGILVNPPGGPEPFHGWLQLTEFIESALVLARSAPSSDVALEPPQPGSEEPAAFPGHA